MADIILGGKTYEGIGSLRLDQTQGGTVDFVEYDTAYEEGRLAGVEEGIKSEYDRFWDAYQQNGNRTNYRCAFGNQWTDDIFMPKYDIIPQGAWTGSSMFKYSSLTDLPALLKRAGIVLDTSKETHMDDMFRETACTAPCIDMTSATYVNLMFFYYYGHTVEKLIVHEGIEWVSAFQNASNLKNITFEGTIGKSIDLHWSPLSKESILSVFNALSASSEGQTVSFSRAAVNTGFETAAGAADGATSEEWLALANTRSNWTIALV